MKPRRKLLDCDSNLKSSKYSINIKQLEKRICLPEFCEMWYNIRNRALVKDETVFHEDDQVEQLEYF